MEQNLPIWGRTVRGLPQDWPLDAAGNPEPPPCCLRSRKAAWPV